MIHVNGSIQRYPLLRITLALGIGIAIETQLLSQVTPWAWIGWLWACYCPAYCDTSLQKAAAFYGQP